jgi:spermidine/putrescine transport system substrate-binding protein
MLKRFSLALLFLSFSLSSFAQEVAGTLSWVCPEGHEGETLDILNWADYIAESTVSDFEAACGISINYVEYDEEYFMYDTLHLGNPGYDLVIASSTLVALLAEDELLIPLNQDLIPNVGNINPNFLHQNYDAENLYSLPYMWGSTGIVYDKAIFPNGIRSWEDVWNYDGSVIWLEDKRAMLGIGLLNLNYSANSMNAGEILQARDYLGERGNNLLGIYGYGEIADLVLNKEASIAVTYNGTLSSLIAVCGCSNYGYSIPEEGSNIFVDNMVVPVDADNTDLAMIFIDYILHPQVNAEISNMGYGSTNLAAVENRLIDMQFLDESGFNPSAEILARMFYIEALNEEAAAYYDVAWSDLLQFYGR